MAEDTVALWRFIAAGLLTEAEQAGDLAAADAAITLLRQAAGVSGPSQAEAASELAGALDVRYELTADPALLDQIIDADRLAVSITQAGDPARAARLFNLSFGLKRRYKRTSEMSTLDEAIATIRAAIQAQSPASQDRAFYLFELLVLQRSRFEASGRATDLDGAIEAGRQAVNAAASSHDPQECKYLSGLSQVLFSRYEGTGDVAVFDESVMMLRAGIEKTPRHDAAWLDRNRNLEVMLRKQEVMLRKQFERTGDLRALDQAISAARDVVAAVAEDSPDGAVNLGTLSNDLHQRFRQTGDPADLTEALGLGRRVIRLTAPGEPSRAIDLSNLSTLLHSWFTHSGEATALDDAVRYGREAIAALGSAAHDRTLVLSNQTTVLNTRATTGEPNRALMDEAVETARKAIAEMPPADPVAAAAQANLALALLTRHESAPDPADLADATAAARQALAGALTSRSVSNLIFATGRRVLQAAYEDRGEPALLDEAIEAARAAVAVTPDDHPQRGARLTVLGSLLVKRFDHGGALPDLDEAVDLADQAARAPGPDEASRGRRLIVLADTLDRRFRQTADLGDLDRAIAAATEGAQVLGVAGSDEYPALDIQTRLLEKRWERVPDAVTLGQAVVAGRRAAELASDNDDQVVQLNRLGNALWHRFQLRGDIADLDEGVGVCRRVAALAGDGERLNQASALANLGVQLGALYVYVGDHTLLNESIQVHRRAVDAADPADPELGRYLNGLANALFRSYERVPDRTLLSDVTMLSRNAVAVTPAGHPNRSGRIMSLAERLATEYKSNGEASILDESIEAGRQALTEAPRDFPSEHALHMSLGGQLRTRFGLTQSRADIDGAIASMRQAMQLVPDGGADRTRYLINLANALGDRYSLTRDSGDIGESIAAFQQAADNRYAAPDERCRAALGWGLGAATAGRVPESLQGYTRAVELLPSVSPHHLQRFDQEYFLSRYSGLAGLAAASALDAGDPERAVTLLEQARGVLLSQALESRGDLSELRERQPAMASEFEALRQALAAADEPPPADAGSVPPTETLAAIRRRRSQAWQELLERIRGIPGFQRFLLPPSITELTAAARHGPVIILSAGTSRSDAVVLTPGGVQAVPLPGFRSGAIRENIRIFYSALATVEDDPSYRAISAAETAIAGVLGWLWDVAAAPVLDTLGYAGQPGPGRPYPRVWWVPTGLACFLPIHAAGHHRGGPANPPPTVMDRVVSSYTPTIRTLIHLRSRPVSSVSAPRALLVALGHTPGAADLPGARREVDRIARLLPGARVLEGEEATQTRVLDGLREASLAHFACHGVSDANRPSHSQLLVHDYMRNPLTVLDISRLHLADPCLAFLSACSTAQPSATLTDEAIHITSAFQLAGYPHVIGTLWSIGDVTAAAVTETVYEQLAPISGVDVSSAASALHAAVLEARDAAPMRPSQWAAYVHVGI